MDAKVGGKGAGGGGPCCAVFDGRGDAPALVDLAATLLKRQKEEWRDLSAGYAALAAVRTREIRGQGWRVLVQFNPRRIVSSGARLDPETVRQRPCFLCPDHRPPEQRAIAYRNDWLILCNPMPIFPGHLTIANRSHLPQSLPDHIGTFLGLAADFGPRMTLFYNGPRAGASAPDHLHFQAAPAGWIPVEMEICAPRKRAGIRHRSGVTISRTVELGRGALVVEGGEADSLATAVREAIAALGRFTPSTGEPQLNLLGRHTGEGWCLILFPRRKHRPAAYFREGDQGLLISPGAVDMGGVLITPREQDFWKLTPELVSEIYREVAFDDVTAEALLDCL
ncbi:MAG: DUF4922 domain-containing protein [Deltaproteobacteria bacterium]|nr:DUF4922 domain-containing protein [Deltaproteobacteria bacterium]